jgi:cobalamin biosynthesis protein CobT
MKLKKFISKGLTGVPDLDKRDNYSFIIKKEVAIGEKAKDVFARVGKKASDLHQVATLDVKSVAGSMYVDSNYGIHLDINSKHTKGGDILVPTAVFDEYTKMDNNQILDIFVGLGIKLVERREHELENIEPKSAFAKPIGDMLLDEVVNMSVCDNFPGYAYYISDVKNYEKKNFLSKMNLTFDNRGSESELVLALSKFIKYPNLMSDKDCDVLQPYHKDIVDILSPYPKTKKDIEKASDALFELLLKKPKENQEVDAPEESQESGESAGSDNNQPTDDTNESNESDSNDSDGKDGDKAQKDSKNSQPKDDGGEEQSSSKPKRMSPGNVMGALNQLNGLIESAKMKLNRQATQMDEMEAAVLEGFITTEPVDGSIVSYVPVNKTSNSNVFDYNRIKSKTARYSTILSRHFLQHNEESKYVLKSQKNGQLDTDKFADVKLRLPNIYTQSRSVKSDDIAICLLIDESGSMSGSKIDRCRELSVLLNEAISKISSIECFIYGHTESNRSGITVFTYKEAGVKSDKHCIASMSARNGNADGYAIEAAMRRVRSKTKRPVLMIIISDGQPAYQTRDGVNAESHMKKIIKSANNRDFSIIHIGIDGDANFAERVYPINYSFTDMATFVPNMVKMIKKVGDGLAKRRETINS